MKAFGYVRVSRIDRAASGVSPQEQRREIEAECQRRGLDLIEVFEDLDISGGTTDRPALRAMLDRADEVDLIIFKKLDRLARNVRGFYEVARQAEEAGVGLVSVVEPIDTATPMGRAMLGIIAVFAELELAVISERSKATHAYLRSQGRAQSRPPYGWRKGSDGQFVEVAEEQARLRGWAERVVAGESFRSIARSEGMPHATVRYALRAERLRDALPADLSRNLQAQLQLREAHFRPGARSLLAGIARCSVCGANLRRHKRDGLETYDCRDGGHVRIEAEWLDGQVVRDLFTFVGSQFMPQASTSADQGEDVAAIERRLFRLEDDFDQGLVSEARYLIRRAPLLERLAAARATGTAPVRSPLPSREDWDRLDQQAQRAAIAGTLEYVEVFPVPTGQRRGQRRPGRIMLGFY